MLVVILNIHSILMGRPAISLCLLLIFFSYQRAYNQAMLTDQFIWDKLLTKTSNPNPKLYEGSPYLIDSFVQGTITLTSNASFSVPVRYNLFEDMLDVIFHGREMEIRHVDLIRKIEFANHRLVLTYYPGKNKEVKGFLFLLDSGKLSLLHKRFITFDEWQPAKALESGPTPAKFREDREEFFIRTSQGMLHKIKTIKEISKLLPEYESKMETYIKVNKVKLKADQLIRLFQYYNSL